MLSMTITGNLTSDLLCKLYLEDKLTDSEIAREFGSTQTSISRLRQKFGIQTILKADRYDLPKEITDLQRSLLLGSMLGDGRLRTTGASTASYSEYHSDTQRLYLDWKAKEWGPFCSHVTPTVDPRGYHGACLYTHASRIFHPYWELFYPKGHGFKDFGGLDLDLIDPLAVAVWFMDDGGKTESYARFSVGPSKINQRIQLQVLSKFGILGSVYETRKREGKDYVLIVDGRTEFSKFVDLVGPYLREDMNYKLDVKVRKAGPAPRDVVTKERVSELLERGLTNSAIAKVLGVPRSSLRRCMDHLGFPAMPPGRPSIAERREYDPVSAAILVHTLDRNSSDYVEQVLKVLSNTSFPSLSISSQKAEHDWAMLVASKTKVEDGTIKSVTSSGSKFCNSFFPYMYEAYHHGGISVHAAWHDSLKMRAAISYQLRVGDPVVPTRVLKALRLIVRAPTNFRPCFAKALVEAYCPEGGTVLDPCAGYGGRACGTIAAGRYYVGIDPHPKAPKAYLDLCRAMGSSIEFHNEAFEDVDIRGLKVNMVLTSPPYYSVERYSNDIKQSWVRYKTWSSWLQGFLTPFVVKSWECLVSGGVMVINTKNAQMGKHVYPIADELVHLSLQSGFNLEQTIALPIGRASKEIRTEPVFVFRKPL